MDPTEIERVALRSHRRGEVEAVVAEAEASAAEARALLLVATEWSDRDVARWLAVEELGDFDEAQLGASRERVRAVLGTREETQAERAEPSEEVCEVEVEGRSAS